jgi:hypothetical protein
MDKEKLSRRKPNATCREGDRGGNKTFEEEAKCNV